MTISLTSRLWEDGRDKVTEEPLTSVDVNFRLIGQRKVHFVPTCARMLN